MGLTAGRDGSQGVAGQRVRVHPGGQADPPVTGPVGKSVLIVDFADVSTADIVGQGLEKGSHKGSKAIVNKTIIWHYMENGPIQTISG